MSGERYASEGVERAALDAITRVVSKCICTQDRGDVVHDAFAKFLPHAWRLIIDEASAYATQVAKSSCADYFARRERLPKTNESIVDRAFANPDAEVEPGSGPQLETPAGRQLLAWLDATASAAELRLGPQERRYLEELRSGQSDDEMAVRLSVHRSRVYQLRIAIGRKARRLAERSRTRRLKEME